MNPLTIIKMLGSALLNMFVTRDMVIYALAQLAKLTDNDIDDNAVELVRCALSGEKEGFKQALKGLVESLGYEMKPKTQ